MNGKNTQFIASNYIVNPILIKTPQPDTTDIIKPHGIEQGILGKQRYNLLGLIKKIITQARLLAVIPIGSFKLVCLNQSGLFEDDAHEVLPVPAQ